MACDPDLAWGEVEVQKVIDSLPSQKAADAVRNYLASDINHLHILHTVLLLIFAKGDVGFFVELDPLPEVVKGGHRVLVFVVWAAELEAHVGFEKLLVDTERLEEEDVELGPGALTDAVDDCFSSCEGAVRGVKDAHSASFVKDVIQKLV